MSDFADLVFEGGGMKGIGLAGAYSAFPGARVRAAERRRHVGRRDHRGARRRRLHGRRAGRDPARRPVHPLQGLRLGGHVPLVGKLAGVLLERGIYEGRFFQSWIAELLAAKGITRFGQLADENAEQPENRWRLRLIASDVTHRRMLVLPNDAGHLGIEPDELEIAYAVRMSMSIPVFFEPVVHHNPHTNADHLIVDGGMLSNFPVWLFDCEGRDPRWPTFGMLLVEPDPKVPIGHRLPGAEHGAELGRCSTTSSRWPRR